MATTIQETGSNFDHEYNFFMGTYTPKLTNTNVTNWCANWSYKPITIIIQKQLWVIYSFTSQTQLFWAAPQW